jgi:ABC-type transport system involved in multi-copper enzyme maturation permease subunit
MRFLPIVARELRVAARRRGTYGLRLLAAAAALAVTFCLSLFPPPGQPPVLMGKSLFTALSIMAFAYALLIGPFITADCLSSEKRDGTLGLLFLTDLRGFDVVLGKWAATSLSGFYGLVAVLPALAIPLVIGGVTPGEYGRTALAVVNAILFSLTAGIFVSALSHDQTKATLGSLILVLTLSGLLPGLMVLLFSGFLGRGIGGFPPVAMASPVYAGQFAADAMFRSNPGLFWISLGTVHGLCWLFVVGAVLVVTRVWRREPAEPEKSGLWLLRLGRTKRWQRRLRRRLARNPVYALAGRHRWPHWVFWVLVGIVTVNIYWLTFGARRNPALYSFHLHFSTAMYFINRVWIAAMACRFFVEARRNNALELLLTTPLQVRTIVRGRRRALWRLFFFPVLAIGLLHWWYVWGSWQPFAKQANSEEMFRWQATLATGSLVSFVTDVLAMTALGGWLSLASRRLPFVILQTFVLVTLLPWASVHLFGGAQLLQKWFPNQYLIAIPLAWVVKNALFFGWAIYKTRRHFRAAAAETYRWRWPRLSPRPLGRYLLARLFS